MGPWLDRPITPAERKVELRVDGFLPLAFPQTSLISISGHVTRNLCGFAKCYRSLGLGLGWAWALINFVLPGYRRMRIPLEALLQILELANEQTDASYPGTS